MARAIHPQANDLATSESSVDENDPCGCRSGEIYEKCHALRMLLGKAGLVVSPAEWEPLPEGVSMPDMVPSALTCTVSLGEFSVAIAIYRYATEQQWILAIQNDYDGMTLWDDRFPTEQAALDAALQAIDEQGLENFVVIPFD